MGLFLQLCLAAVCVFAVDGQATGTGSACEGRPDFSPCPTPETLECDLDVSSCFCKSNTSFCRCNNYKDEFYLGENCNQKWTTLTFALVASLPGVTLAVVVGVTVYVLVACRKPSRSTRSDMNTGRGGNQMKSISAAEEDMFPGMVFASDLNAHPSGGPKGFSSGPRPPQGGTANPYSPSASMRTADRPPMGGPRPLSSTYETIPPPSARGGGSFDRPGAGGTQQPYSYAAGPGQVISNPYVKTSNPYEEISPDQYNPPSQGFNDRRVGATPVPPYSAPDYASRSAFPRAQLGRGY